MALTEDQTLTLAEIVGLSAYRITDQILAMGARYTAAVEARIVAKITRWNAISGKFTRLHPLEANKGVDTDPNREKNKIRKEMALLLEREDWFHSIGAMQIEMIRG